MQTGEIWVFSPKAAVIYQKFSKYVGMQNFKAKQKNF